MQLRGILWLLFLLLMGPNRVRGDNGPTTDDLTYADLYGGVAGRQTQSCPCSPTSQCSRPYGQDINDVMEFGSLPPCQEPGLVRCCSMESKEVPQPEGNVLTNSSDLEPSESYTAIKLHDDSQVEDVPAVPEVPVVEEIYQVPDEDLYEELPHEIHYETEIEGQPQEVLVYEDMEALEHQKSSESGEAAADSLNGRNARILNYVTPAKISMFIYPPSGVPEYFSRTEEHFGTKHPVQQQKLEPAKSQYEQPQSESYQNVPKSESDYGTMEHNMPKPYVPELKPLTSPGNDAPPQVQGETVSHLDTPVFQNQHLTTQQYGQSVPVQWKDPSNGQQQPVIEYHIGSIESPQARPHGQGVPKYAETPKPTPVDGRPQPNSFQANRNTESHQDFAAPKPIYVPGPSKLDPNPFQHTHNNADPHVRLELPQNRPELQNVAHGTSSKIHSAHHPSYQPDAVPENPENQQQTQVHSQPPEPQVDFASVPPHQAVPGGQNGPQNYVQRPVHGQEPQRDVPVRDGSQYQAIQKLHVPKLYYQQLSQHQEAVPERPIYPIKSVPDQIEYRPIAVPESSLIQPSHHVPEMLMYRPIAHVPAHAQHQLIQVPEFPQYQIYPVPESLGKPTNERVPDISQYSPTAVPGKLHQPMIVQERWPVPERSHNWPQPVPEPQEYAYYTQIPSNVPKGSSYEEHQPGDVPEYQTYRYVPKYRQQTARPYYQHLVKIKVPVPNTFRYQNNHGTKQQIVLANQEQFHERPLYTKYETAHVRRPLEHVPELQNSEALATHPAKYVPERQEYLPYHRPDSLQDSVPKHQQEHRNEERPTNSIQYVPGQDSSSVLQTQIEPQNYVPDTEKDPRSQHGVPGQPQYVPETHGAEPVVPKPTYNQGSEQPQYGELVKPKVPGRQESPDIPVASPSVPKVPERTIAPAYDTVPKTFKANQLKYEPAEGFETVPVTAEETAILVPERAEKPGTGPENVTEAPEYEPSTASAPKPWVPGTTEGKYHIITAVEQNTKSVETQENSEPLEPTYRVPETENQPAVLEHPQPEEVMEKPIDPEEIYQQQGLGLKSNQPLNLPILEPIVPTEVPVGRDPPSPPAFEFGFKPILPLRWSMERPKRPNTDQTLFRETVIKAMAPFKPLTMFQVPQAAQSSKIQRQPFYTPPFRSLRIARRPNGRPNRPVNQWNPSLFHGRDAPRRSMVPPYPLAPNGQIRRSN